MRFLAVVLIAVLGIAAAAYAQTNSYDFTGSVPKGGTKAKPKPTGFTFNYTIADPAGNLPKVVKAYKFTIQGSKVTTSAAKKTCTAASINAATNASGCSASAIVGTGSVHADIGTSGQPKSASCDLKLTAYAGGPNKVALFLDSSAGAGLSFTVPQELRHQLGLDVAVTSVKSTWKKITKKTGSKTVGYFSGTGCKSKRSATVVFTAEDDTTTPLTKEIGSC
jgi:hypothetical protein